MDLSSDNLEFSTISPNWVSPVKRKNFCTVSFEDTFYVFGGIDNEENYLTTCGSLL